MACSEPLLRLKPGTVTEAPGAELVFTLVLPRESCFEAADGTAVAGLDYVATAGTFSLPAGYCQVASEHGRGGDD